MFELVEEPERLVVVAPGTGRHVDDPIRRSEQTELDRDRVIAVTALQCANRVHVHLP